MTSADASALDDYVQEQTLATGVRRGDVDAKLVLRAEARRRFAGMAGSAAAIMEEIDRGLPE